MSLISNHVLRSARQMFYGPLPYQKPRDVTTFLPRNLAQELASDPLFAFEDSLIFCEPYILFQSIILLCHKESSSVLAEFAKGRLRGLTPSAPSYNEWKEFVEVKDRTFLHFAAVFGDVALAYECVRLGVEVNQQDIQGATPLLLALQMLGTHSRFAEFNSDLGEEAFLDEMTRSGIHRMRRIVTMLIEQGADVDLANHDGVMPFLYTWMSSDWPTLELLLRCGVRVPRRVRAIPEYHTQADERRMAVLRRRVQYLPGRPPRPCPCWSGKLLSECHALGPKPYPPDLMCMCGSRKAFRKCCQRRDFETWEEWDESRKRLKVVNRRNDPVEALRQRERAKRGLSVDDDGQPTPGERRRWDGEFTDLMVSNGLADPAYMYASTSPGVGTFAIPWEKQFSKLECQMRSQTWNAAVDKYIALGTDPRPRLAIEQNAKIGLDGGPLFKHCEAEDCTVIEGTGSKMKCCGRCKRIYYCSTQCQRADWANHKVECQDGSHPVQMLHSQETFKYMVDRALDPDYERSESGSDHDTSDPEESDYEESEGEALDREGSEGEESDWETEPEESEHSEDEAQSDDSDAAREHPLED